MMVTDAPTYTTWPEPFGLRRPSTARRCPNVVAGRRCRAWTGHEPCACQRHWHVLDHAQMWLGDTGAHILTAEPYDATGDELREFLTDLDQLDLQASVTGTSPHYPGRTFAIIVTRRSATTSEVG